MGWKDKVASKVWGAIRKTSKTPSGLQHPVITSFKPKKNLTKRRDTFEMLTGAVDKQYKKSGLGITDKGKKIKRDAALEGSKIHDKYEKLQKILDKRK